MKKLITLLEIELKKALPILLTTLILMTAASTWAFYSGAQRMNSMLMQDLLANEMTVAEYVESSGGVTLVQAIESYGQMLPYLLFVLSAMLLVAVLSFYLWYKEWFGQSKRIYMLFSLRGSRFTILISKLITVIAATWIFYGVVLINLWIGGVVLRLVLPDGAVADGLVRGVILNGNTALAFIFPLSLIDFMYKIFFVMVAFSGITVVVLMDRSKKILGFILGLVYCILVTVVYSRTQSMFLFFDERPLVDWSFVILASALSLLISYLLLNKKVSI